jgi:hypothetical protein
MDYTANDLYTIEGFEKMARTIREKLKADFEKDGYVAPLSFVVMTKDPSGLTLPEPGLGIVPALFPDAEAKDHYAKTLIGICEVTEAIGLIQASECWIKTLAVTENIPTGGLEHVEGREEIVNLQLSHLGYPAGYERMWFAKIIRTADGKATLGEFDESLQLHKAEGRFTGLLPRSSKNRMDA